MILTKSIVDLFLVLPLDFYLSAEELREISVTQINVSTDLTVSDIQNAFQAFARSCVLSSRLHTKSQVKTRFYAASSRAETCVLFSSRSPDWKIPTLTFSVSERRYIQDLVNTLNENLRAHTKRTNVMGEEDTPGDRNVNSSEVVAGVKCDTNEQGQQEDSTTTPEMNIIEQPQCGSSLAVEDDALSSTGQEKENVSSSTSSIRVCNGFVGTKIDELFKQSLIDGPLQNFRMNKPFPTSFGLPLCIATNKGGEEVYFVQNDDRSWKLVSKQCQVTYPSTHHRQLYCPSCCQQRVNVRNICKRILSGGNDGNIDATSEEVVSGRLSTRRCYEFSHRPEKFKEFLEDVRRNKDRELEKTRKESLCRNRLQNAMDCYKESVVLDNVSDADIGKKALQLLKPLIVQRFGDQSDSAIIWEQMIDGMSRPIDSKPRYSNTALCFGIELAAQTKAEVYDKVAKLLNLPPRNHCKRVQRRIVYGKDGSYSVGFQEHTVSLFWKLAKDKGLFNKGELKVCLAFDSMIMKKGVILSTRNKDKGRLIGCTLSESLTTLENQFENYVETVTRQARQCGEKIFDETINDPFQHNREHLVCYARCLTPGIELVSFIAGAWNLPSCRKVDLVGIVHDLLIGLHNYNFEARVITCDNAQCNEGFLKSMACLKAKDILPETLLTEFDLPGDLCVAMKHPLTLKPVIYISDPPHCIKRLAGAVRTRDLQYGDCPLTGQLMLDVWQAVQDSHGGDVSLVAHRKYKLNDFIDGGGFASMNVASASRLFSNTSRKMLDEVAGDPEKYPMHSSRIGKHADRKTLFSKMGEMCTLINNFFDLCNGKEGGNPFVRFHSCNGEKYQRKFMEVVQWFVHWERSLLAGLKTKEQKAIARKHFIATETFRCVKYVCYGFACLIQYECIGKDDRSGISPCKINQDICEQHFANVRRSCATHSNPNENECMASIMKSAFFRLENIRKSNCGALTQDQQRSIVPLTTAKHDSMKVEGVNASCGNKNKHSLSRQRSTFGQTSKKRRIATVSQFSYMKENVAQNAKKDVKNTI